MSFITTIFNQLKNHREENILFEVPGENTISFTCKDLLTMIDQVRSYLRKRHLQPGERVALLAPNSAQWIAIDLAVLAEGGILVPLYSRMTSLDVNYILKDCVPRLLILSDENLVTLIPSTTMHYTLYKEIFEKTETLSILDLNEYDSNLPATIIYTSGTSGEPKGVILTQHNILYMCQQTASHLQEMYNKMDISSPCVFHFLPLCFAGSRLMLWTHLYLGKAVYLSSDLEAIKLKTVKPHYFLTVPLVLERIKQGIETQIDQKNFFIKFIYKNGMKVYNQQQKRILNWLEKILLFCFVSLGKTIKANISTELKFLISGSAPLHSETEHWFNSLGIPLFQVYGLTETTGIISIDDPDNLVPGCVGFPLEKDQVKINENGELLCRGPHVFKGYWNKPDATHEAIKEGWFYTGDQAKIDEQGCIKILGRSKALLVLSSGHKVAPEPIEQQILNSCKEVEHVMVMGHERPYLSALITGNVSENIINDIIDRLNATLVHYKKIRAIKKLHTAFSIENGCLTPNGKLKRKHIEYSYQSIIEGLYD